MSEHLMDTAEQWQFWVDRGGTFTDIVARAPDGHLITDKLLSENPEHYSDAVIEGIRRIVSNSNQAEQGKSSPFMIKMGTTVATNALLERKGEDTLLLITQGFADALQIGYQHRPELFSLKINLPQMLYRRVVEVEERVSAHGDVLTPLNETDIYNKLQTAFAAGLRSVAVVLMHGYRYAQHELRVAELARQVGFTHVSISSQASALMKLVSRGDTTVVDAYLSPILKRYVEQVTEHLTQLNPAEHRLQFMQSNGGLTDASRFSGKDAILSGPAGGVIGMVETALQAGFNRLIGFDMGGTSTDVCHYAGELERTSEIEVAGVRMRASMMHIHTVAAGGGSVLQFDGSRFRVGPDSSGAHPGPASYGNDGPLTVTDCNVMLGNIQPQYFPQVFGEDGQQSLDTQAVKQKFKALTDAINQTTTEDRSSEQIASGFLKIAVDNMANAIKHISVQRGYNVAEYTLCCFGGAGGQHACLVADALSIKRVFLHPYAGVLSAYGMGLADLRQIHERSVEQPLNDALLAKLESISNELSALGQADLVQQGVELAQITQVVKVYCYYQGSDTRLAVALSDSSDMHQSFAQQHQQAFGFVSANKRLIVQSIEVEVVASMSMPQTQKQANKNTQLSKMAEHMVVIQGERQATPFYDRQSIPEHTWVNGPAIIVEQTGTIVIEPGWRGEITADDNMVLERYQSKSKQVAIGTQVDPVMLEIFNNLFMSIAEQMGSVLESTAVSVNIKERLDFSCAIFNAEGDLIANAPHVPVHLGSMSESIKTVVAEHRQSMKKGDIYVLNAPYNGGTHLPDITIIKPVFGDADQVIFYVATRGHHADIGGITPGSMPSNSTSVTQEGILLDNLKLVDAGVFQESLIRDILAEGEWPARNIDTNIADLKAQIAACEKGMQELLNMVDDYSLSVVHAYMKHVQDNAEEAVRQVLLTLNNGAFCYEMDDGSKIKVSLTLDKQLRQATLDFSGTSAQHAQNFNAPSSITRAAVLYVFRCLVDDQIPLNEGCLKPLSIVLPEQSMINPEYPAAVVAGNVETSQAIVGTLLGALGVASASQGTMNNMTWGNEQFQYYETLCGGEGASQGHHGSHAVHTHMTNSRLTDPEVMEWRFPVLLESFAIRKNSGGKGEFCGGNGVERQIRFEQDMTASLLTGHRRIAPYALNGGEPGAVGENILIRTNGEKVVLDSTVSVEVKQGESLCIKTPGGGGFGTIK